MCAWFSRVRAPKPSPTAEESVRLNVPGDLWTKCPKCAGVIYTKEILANQKVCTKCDHHFRISADDRIKLICDLHSFEELDKELKSNDPLGFKDSVKYRERLKSAEKKSKAVEAVKTGRAKINGQPVMIGVFDFSFMGGSMGMVVGERLTRIVELAISEGLPVIIVSSSGGARMQEGIYSLMQMAKVTAALVELGNKGLPYISLLTDPTTGGVAASFSMLGDIHISEPGALIGFAGPRVIEQTIRKKLPAGFQRAEFLLDHGMIDLVVHRSELKQKLSQILGMLVAD